MWHILSDLVLLITIGVLIVSHRANRKILERIERREAEGRQELIDRAVELQRRTDKMAEQVRKEAEARHNRTVEAALAARDAARAAASIAADTSAAVHQLTDAKEEATDPPPGGQL